MTFPVFDLSKEEDRKKVNELLAAVDGINIILERVLKNMDESSKRMDMGKEE